MALKISFVNNKGGSGKTTTVVNIAGVINRLYPKKKLLIIDVDAQGNASRAFNIDNETEINKELTTYQIFLQNLNPKDAIIHNVGGNKNIDLIPASMELNFLEFDEINIFTKNNGISNKLDLKEFYFNNLNHKLDEIDKLYDYIFFDTPPELKSVTSSVLSISNSVIIPYEPDAFSVDGVRNIVDRIQDIQQNFNPQLTINGFLATKYRERTVIQREFVKVINSYAKALEFPVINTKIPHSIRYPNSNGIKPATLMVKNIDNERNKAVKAYFDLVDELTEKKILKF